MLTSARSSFFSLKGKAVAQKKKLQVFISSTYEDLRDERQAAVEAILTAGHIPAGMELFTAGDQSQMQVIHRWINESDVFLLILGGRYGSIEPQTKKSYIHLEYDYALEQNKPFFAVIITDAHLEEKMKTHGIKAMEREHTEKYIDFKNIVRTRMVRFWSNPDQIKLAIHESMREFIDRPDVVGWVPSNEAVNTGPVLEEIARMTKENSILREQLEKSSKEEKLYHGLTYNEMYDTLKKEKISLSDSIVPHYDTLKEVADIFEEELCIIHAFFMARTYIINGDTERRHMLNIPNIKILRAYGLIETPDVSHPIFTQQGRAFLMRLMQEDKAKQAHSLGY